MFAAKTYRQGVQVLLAACDEELLGTIHQEGQFRLEVTEGFYDGERVDAKTLAQAMRGCTVANLVGQEAVGLAVDLGLVDEANILRIGDVPHAQFLLVADGA